MSQLIQVVPKTTYKFDGRAGSTQQIVLEGRVSTLGFASGALIVRVHATSNFSRTAQAHAKVYNQSVDGNDPATFFVGTTPIATSDDIDATTSAGTLSVTALGSPISSSVRVVLEWSQGSDAATGAQTLTLGVDLVGRV